MKNGRDFFVWPNGDEYDGQWKNDRRHGSGTMRYSDGTEYVGDWVNDERTVDSKLNGPDSDTYDGQWKKDCKNILPGRGLRFRLSYCARSTVAKGKEIFNRKF